MSGVGHTVEMMLEKPVFLVGVEISVRSPVVRALGPQHSVLSLIRFRMSQPHPLPGFGQLLKPAVLAPAGGPKTVGRV